MPGFFVPLDLLFTSWVVAFGAPEVCNAVDDDGDGQIDEAPIVWYADDDGDGAGDPSALSVTPTCFAPPDTTADGLDCDDRDADIQPGGTEAPNAIDDDCDGLVDEQNLPPACTVDHDADSTFLFCDRDRTWDNARSDCDAFDYHLLTIDDPAENAAVIPSLGPSPYWWMGWHDPPGPDSWEWADGTADWGDNWDPGEPNDPGSHDCGFVGNPGGTWFNWDCEAPYPFVCEADCVLHPTWADDDGDGFGDPGSEAESCGIPAGRVKNDRDCDDTDDTDGVRLWYADTDGDGFGAVTTFQSRCTAPAGFVADGSDCDDGDPTLNPDTAWYADTDGDGFGGVLVATGCSGPQGTLRRSTDCDDGDPLVNPDGTEVCGGGDEDCDSDLDDADPSLDPTSTTSWYPDADGDGFGVRPAVRACAAPDGHAAVVGDCDDADPLASPAAFEQCDLDDDDCDGQIDEDVEDREWFTDADGDGFGRPGTGVVDCVAPDGTVPDDTDCDDGDPGVNPAASEIADDGIDQDCDGIGGGARVERIPDPDPALGSTDPGCACDTSSGTPWLVVPLVLLLVRRPRPRSAEAC